MSRLRDAMRLRKCGMRSFFNFPPPILHFFLIFSFVFEFQFFFVTFPQESKFHPPNPSNHKNTARTGDIDSISFESDEDAAMVIQKVSDKLRVFWRQDLLLDPSIVETMMLKDEGEGLDDNDEFVNNTPAMTPTSGLEKCMILLLVAAVQGAAKHHHIASIMKLPHSSQESLMSILKVIKGFYWRHE